MLQTFTDTLVQTKGHILSPAPRDNIMDEHRRDSRHPGLS